MSFNWQFFATVLLCLACLTADGADQHCHNGVDTKIIVEVGADNAERLMTYIRDDTGYPRALSCKWTLTASSYEKPVQMLLEVVKDDFDLNNATKEDCDASRADVFNFTLTGELTPKDQVHKERWCSSREANKSEASDKPKSSVTFKRAVANLWDSANQLQVEFHSDNVQSRLNAKGIQLNVWVLSKNYCHRELLYFNGSCYLLTPERLTFDEALSEAKFLLGNLKQFASSDDVTQFLQANQDRSAWFPYKPAFNMTAEKCWIGNFIIAQPGGAASYNESEILDRFDNCAVAKSSVAASNCPPSDTIRRYGMAVQVIAGKPVFTCEPMSTRLPALLSFPQISNNQADRATQTFPSCSELPTLPTQPPPPTPLPPASTAPTPQSEDSTIMILAIACIIAFIIL